MEVEIDEEDIKIQKTNEEVEELKEKYSEQKMVF